MWLPVILEGVVPTALPTDSTLLRGMVYAIQKKNARNGET
jgi:hypothetical protein